MENPVAKSNSQKSNVMTSDEWVSKSLMMTLQSFKALPLNWQSVLKSQWMNSVRKGLPKDKAFESKTQQEMLEVAAHSAKWLDEEDRQLGLLRSVSE
jgi:hypothetical protein